MKSFTESKGGKPFNWNNFLAKQNIDQTLWWHAQDLAADWVTCACGNQCAIIPRTDCGRPMDDELFELGSEFCDAINDENKDYAKKILVKIEKRSRVLIEKMIKELKDAQANC